MAVANLVVRIGADIAELKKGVAATTSEISKVGKSFQTMAATAKAASAVIGLSLGIGAVKAFGGEVLRMADDVQKTADKTGLLTDEVQRLSYIANQSSNTLESLTGAIGQMQNRLASGDKSALGAVKDLGLSFSDLAKQRPYDQFQAIAEAIAKVPNPADRARVAMDLFGRAGLDILPTLLSNLRQLGDEAPRWSEATQKALVAAGDNLDRVNMRFTIFAGTVAGAFLNALDKVDRAMWQAAASFQEFVAKLIDLAAKLPGGAKALSAMGFSAEELRHKAAFARERAAELTAQIERVGKSATDAVAPIAGVAENAKKSGDAAKRASEALKAYNDQIERGIEWTKRHIEATEQKYKLLAEAPALFQRATRALTGTTVSQAIAAKAADDMTFAWRRAREGAVELRESVAEASAQIIADVVTMGDQVRDSLKASFGRIPEILISAFTGGGGLAGAVKAIGSLMGSNLGKAVGSSLGSFFGKEGAGMFSKALGGMFSAVLPGIGALMGPLIAKIGGALANIFDKNKGRDIVKDFAESFGGFDALHDKLLELGEQGEELWKRLTQGVGRNNPSQAKAAIEAITKALEKTTQSQENAAVATEAGAAATIETATQASLALETLKEKIHDNQLAWTAWSEVATAAIARVADALRALPTMGTPTFSGGGFTLPASSHGTVRPMSGQQLGISGGNMTIIYETDGQVIGQTAAKYMPGILRLRGV